MRGTYVLAITLSGILLGCVLGCGDLPPEPTSAEPAAVIPAELPELDEPIGPLDEGRVNVSRPKGWHVAPRSSKYVVRFLADRTLGYPTIVVTAEDFAETRDVDKNNVGQFVEARRADPKMAKLIEPIEPIELGGRQYITYHRRAQVKDKEHKIIELLFFETVVAGRKYTVELRTLRDTLDKYRPHTMAVAGAIEFIEDAAVEPSEPPTEPAALDGPDEATVGEFEDQL